METLKLLKNTSEKFIKYILNTRNNNEIQNNGKLNFIIQEMELTWELNFIIQEMELTWE